jgi:phospholipid transport system transporter-binding protein
VRTASASTLLANRSSGSKSFEIVAGTDGKLQVRGALTFATARRAREEGMNVLAASEARELEVDCRGITASDSAGLTVLLDWLALAKKQGRSLRFLNLPQGLLAIAKISEVDGLLQRGV